MYTEIDFETWERKEIYNRFSPCLYAITTTLDITNMINNIKKKGLKFYPTMNYCVAKVCNMHKEFRYANLNGKIVYFDEVHPLYTVPRKNGELFTHKMTKWNENFSEFYQSFLADYEEAISAENLYCDKDLPENLVCTSIMPDIVITGLDFNFPISEYGAYIPFITFGKFQNIDGKFLISAGTQFRHEVNDGYHANKFYKELEKICNNLFSETNDLK